MTNDAVAAFAGDNADGVVAESRLAVALGGWDGCRAGIVDRRDGTTGGTGDVVSSLGLFVARSRIRVGEGGMRCFINYLFVCYFIQYINKAA